MLVGLTSKREKMHMRVHSWKMHLRISMQFQLNNRGLRDGNAELIRSAIRLREILMRSAVTRITPYLNNFHALMRACYQSMAPNWEARI